eukprot:symbB.v1.2.038599.t1/scaffold6075.1/size21117/1
MGHFTYTTWKVDGATPHVLVYHGSLQIATFWEWFSNDRPSWHISAGCRLASQTASHWRPVNCDTATSCAISGGTDPLVKVFSDVVLGPTYLSGEPISAWFDVCYCDDECDDSTSGDAFEAKDFGFFKVGRLRSRPLRL